MNISNDDILILFFLQKYTFLTITQAVYILDNKRSYSSIARRLKNLQDGGLLDSYGGYRVGYYNTPKICFLTKQGFEILETESGIPSELLGRFKKTSQPRWSAKTKHRIYLIDIFLSLERAVRGADHLTLEKVFLEYRRIARHKKTIYETTDFVAEPEAPEHKIVPDGAFVLRSDRTDAKGLFFLELDTGSEQIVSHISKNADFPLVDKFKKYDRYLTGGRYSKKYQDCGPFDHFTMLFVTLSPTRLGHIRERLAELPENLHD